jgi:hypothetical protein
MADWIPPQHAKLGKKVQDLLGKTFQIKNQLKTVNKSANGVKLESSFGGDTSVTGTAKGTYTKGKCFEIEGEFKTVGEVNAKVTSKSLSPGLEVSVSGKSKKTLVGLSAKYAQPFYALAADVCHTISKNKTVLYSSAMIGWDGLSVGLAGKLEPLSEDPVTDYNCGAEYTQSDLTVSLFTQNKGSVITASYWQKISGDCELGASLKMDPDMANEMKEGQHNLTVGAKYKLDSHTDIAVKGDTSGTIYANIDHVLSNPSLKLGIGASFDSTKSENVLAADKFGISCTFGDF